MTPQPPLLFAHRGGMAHNLENSLEAFQFALNSGMPGLESDVWITADHVCVLSHSEYFRRRGLRRKISRHTHLPDSILSLAKFYAQLGSEFELSLDIKPKDKAAACAVAQAVITTALEAEETSGQPVLGNLWLCHPDWQLLAKWREQWTNQSCARIKLVNSVPTGRMGSTVEKRASQLSSAGVDALNCPHGNWGKALVAQVHRFGILAFAWDAQFEHVIQSLVAMGVDAIYGDHIGRLLKAGRRKVV